MASLGNAATPPGVDARPGISALEETVAPWPPVHRGDVIFTDEPEDQASVEEMVGQLWPRGGDAGNRAPGYIHTQSMMATTWTVVHNLGKHPAVSVEDAVGNVLYGSIVYTSDSALTITFHNAITGRANCV